MGNIQTHQPNLPVPHVKIYTNILAIQSPAQKAQMIQTVLSSPEHLASARQAGVYGHLLQYVQAVQSGSAIPLLPGSQVSVGSQLTTTSQHLRAPPSASEKGNEKALNYFSACLRILALEEEVALTEDALKVAYKKAVIRAHPDKGGSEKEFEAVTRAYAYLGEILRRLHGGRAKEGVMQAPNALSSSREQEADKWKHVQPVSLNPDKMNLKAFNEMFEQTRIPDPEETGYGDWLKGGDTSTSEAPKFSGKFNREVFHKMFEDDAKNKSKGGSQNSLVVQEMSLASRIGYATELGRGAREDFTVTPHEGKMAFTDLKKAYTEYNTFSQDTAGVQVSSRSFEQMSSDRKAAPPPLADHEMAALAAAEASAKKAEEQRRLRMAQQAVEENSYFERMKRLVITNK